jgi:hypothetical protein
MATKLGDMTSAGTLAGTELVYVQVGTATGDERKSTVDDFKTYALGDFSANGLALGALTYAGMRAALDLEAGTDFNAYSANLAALSAMASTGLMARTGSGAYTTRTLTAPAAGLTVADGDGVAGNPTLALANDLAALEALSGTNTIYYRSASDTWTAVTIGGNLTFSGGTLDAVGAGTGTVTHTAGALTLNQLVFGNGSADIKVGNLTGDVTTSGGTATTIANDAVTTAKILNSNVTLAKLANIADQTILGNNTGGSAAPVALTAAQVKVVLAPSIQTVASAATVTPTFADDQVNITAQAAALALANPTGTAIPAWGLVIRIKDNGTARAISYDTQYRAIGVTLPTTTVISKTLYLGLIYNSTDTKWDVVAVAQEA